MIKVELRELGTIEYQACYNQMIGLINESPKFHSIWVLEHEPVFTLGISEKEIHAVEMEIYALQSKKVKLSEMAQMRNLQWWTVEYGLIGPKRNCNYCKYKISLENFSLERELS